MMTERVTAATFIVRMLHDGPDSMSGVVERVRTGAKEPFENYEGLCRAIAKMVEREAADDAR